MRDPSLLVLLDYLELLADVRPDKFDRAAAPLARAARP
jgi:hypothetical protein